MTRQAKAGDTVSIRFTASTEDGVEIASSEEGEFITVNLGADELLPALEDQVMGMSASEKKEFVIGKDDAFPYADELVFSIPRTEFPEDVPFEKGLPLQLQGDEEEIVNVTVVSFTDEQVELDANPPFAGRELTVVVELATIHE